MHLIISDFIFGPFLGSFTQESLEIKCAAMNGQNGLTTAYLVSHNSCYVTFAQTVANFDEAMSSCPRLGTHKGHLAHPKSAVAINDIKKHWNPKCKRDKTSFLACWEKTAEFTF